MNIVFMGSAPFGIPTLEKLCEEGHDIKGIVSTPPKEKGRGLIASDSPVVQFAKSKGMHPLLTPADLKDAQFIGTLKNLNADLFVVVAFRILPKEVFLLPSLGTINIHASLLPRYRGPAPIQRAIADGENHTGVTIFRIDQGIDTGRIILQKECAVFPEETAPQLYDRLARLGADNIIEALVRLRTGQEGFVEQNDAASTPAPKLKKAEGNINWSLPAQQIFNKIRAFKPFPGSYTFYKGRRLSIESAVPVASQTLHGPGTIIAVGDEGFDVQCGIGSLRILEVKPEGKKNMNVRSFLAGRKISIGARFERQ